MLLPALSAARERARSASCTSNLKQIGLASNLYSGDNKDFFVLNTFPGSKYWWAEIAHYIAADGEESDDNAVLRQRYRMLACPSDQLFGDVHTTYKNNVTNYGLNSAICGNSSYSSFTLGEIEDPTKTLLACDLKFDSTPGRDSMFVSCYFQINNTWYKANPNNKYGGYLNWRHGSIANVAFTDGHVDGFAAGGDPDIAFRDPFEVHKKAGYPSPAAQDYLY